MVAGMQEWASQESGSGCSQFLKVTVQELALCYSAMFSWSSSHGAQVRGGGVGDIDPTSQWQECQRIWGLHLETIKFTIYSPPY